MKEKPPYNASAVANYFLQKAAADDRPMTMLKLIKLCYIAHGWTLGLAHRPLLREKVEAWKYGPVIPSLYHEFKHCGRRNITAPATELDLETFQTNVPKIPNKDVETRRILDKVWDVYRSVSGGRLIDKTHADGTPWKNTFDPRARGKVIPNEEIESHYTTVLRRLMGVNE